MESLLKKLNLRQLKQTKTGFVNKINNRPLAVSELKLEKISQVFISNTIYFLFCVALNNVCCMAEGREANKASRRNAEDFIAG